MLYLLQQMYIDLNLVEKFNIEVISFVNISFYFILFYFNSELFSQSAGLPDPDNLQPNSFLCV